MPNFIWHEEGRNVERVGRDKGRDKIKIFNSF